MHPFSLWEAEVASTAKALTRSAVLESIHSSGLFALRILMLSRAREDRTGGGFGLSDVPLLVGDRRDKEA